MTIGRLTSDWDPGMCICPTDLNDDFNTHLVDVPDEVWKRWEDAVELFLAAQEEMEKWPELKSEGFRSEGQKDDKN